MMQSVTKRCSRCGEGLDWYQEELCEYCRGKLE